jgi:hypothetical protein
MTARISLATEESSRALEILQQELQTFRPSRGQVLAYYMLQWNAVAFLVALLVVFFTREGSTFREVVTGVVGFTALAMLPILLLNLKLVSRLWRAARMRRRLGLTEPLAAVFQAQRRKTWLLNFLTAVLAVVGVVFVLLAVAVPAIVREELEVTGSRSVLIGLFIGLYLILGITLISLHYLRRGMERLAVVEGLRTTLSAVASDRKEQAGAVSVSPEDYDLIAKIERDQIIRERYQNIARSKAGARTSGYVVQMGVEAQQGKSRLPAAERLLVDEQIVKLMADPQSSDVVTDPQRGLRRLPVANTSAEILFEVDEADRRVKIVGIESSAASRAAHS